MYDGNCNHGATAHHLGGKVCVIVIVMFVMLVTI